MKIRDCGLEESIKPAGYSVHLAQGGQKPRHRHGHCSSRTKTLTRHGCEISKSKGISILTEAMSYSCQFIEDCSKEAAYEATRS